MLGNKIINNINALKKLGVIVKEAIKGEDQIYLLNGRGYRAELKINPKSWLGIEFHTVDIKGKDVLIHEIDTDLYPISRPKYYEFAEDIENEIVEFLTAIREGKILIGEKKGRKAMIIPKGNKFLLTIKGRFFISSRYYDDLEKLKLEGNFESLNTN